MRGWTSRTMIRSLASSSNGSRRGGFTLLEMLAVIFIIGITLALVLPNLDRLTPKHRLRAAAREVASTIELCRHQAVTRAATYGIAYDLDGRTPTYRLILPADEFGDREPLAPRTLPPGVFLRAVVLPNGNRVGVGGETQVDFSPTGEDGGHIVILENENEEVLSVKFLSMVGIASFSEGEASFEVYRGG